MVPRLQLESLGCMFTAGRLHAAPRMAVHPEAFGAQHGPREFRGDDCARGRAIRTARLVSGSTCRDGACSRGHALIGLPRRGFERCARGGLASRTGRWHRRAHLARGACDGILVTIGEPDVSRGQSPCFSREAQASALALVGSASSGLKRKDAHRPEGRERQEREPPHSLSTTVPHRPLKRPHFVSPFAVGYCRYHVGVRVL
mmetsp:Transcript_17963/g.40199  ORF Transcript_17963/g.40199 Transcript_17963/m.40199 type:complete len:202 (+) Transcript_17963:331-936(+)